MTVADLIAGLQKLPPALPVVLEQRGPQSRDGKFLEVAVVRIEFLDDTPVVILD